MTQGLPIDKIDINELLQENYIFNQQSFQEYLKEIWKVNSNPKS
jgi:hypothetical protein